MHMMSLTYHTLIITLTITLTLSHTTACALISHTHTHTHTHFLISSSPSWVTPPLEHLRLFPAQPQHWDEDGPTRTDHEIIPVDTYKYMRGVAYREGYQTLPCASSISQRHLLQGVWSSSHPSVLGGASLPSQPRDTAWPALIS